MSGRGRSDGAPQVAPTPRPGHKGSPTPKRPSPGRDAARRRQVHEAVKEGVFWGAAVALLGIVTPPSPGAPHGGERVTYSLLSGLIIGTMVAVGESEEVVPTRRRSSSRSGWLPGDDGGGS